MSAEVTSPGVSIVIPVFNAAKTIGACIQSVIDSDFPANELEILVVDNGCTDSTATVLREFAGRITVLEESTRGPAAARNRGIRGARGRVIAMTDADCVVDRDWVRSLIAPLCDGGVGIAGGRILSIDPDHEIASFGDEIHDHEKAIEVYSPPYVITMNWAAPAALFAAIGHFDEELLRCEDVDLSYRAVQDGWKLVYAPAAVVRHHNERTWRGLFGEGIAHGLYSVQAIRKHAGFLEAFGHRRVNLASYTAIAASLRRAAAGPESERARCELVFNCGKKVGKLAGSIRFGHLEL